MSKAIERRLAKIERRLKPPVRRMLEIHINGGFTSGIAPIASFGAHELEARSDETFEAFRARAKAAAEAEGATQIVFGGLSGP